MLLSKENWAKENRGTRKMGWQKDGGAPSPPGTVLNKEKLKFSQSPPRGVYLSSLTS